MIRCARSTSTQRYRPAVWQLTALLEFARPGHVLYGSDWPYIKASGVDYFNNLYDGAPISDDTRAASDRSNAEQLFPRLATPPANRS
ncbi:amidohydrolase family protein [Gordonia effusa]|uniref:amidohydrolase family protein n=1 Tax=Gordonia effusa TaxID=263908 RepID=UPI003570952E